MTERAKTPKSWQWTRVGDKQHLIDGRGRNRCTVWSTGTWHTWNAHGVGGENAGARTVNEAKEQATLAVIRQGWARLVVASEGVR